MTLNEIKCSGVWIGDGLIWKRPVRKNCFCGHAKLRRLWDVLPPAAKKMYCALVLPYLDYCSQDGAQNRNRWPKRDYSLPLKGC